jgi:hypothetical protein
MQAQTTWRPVVCALGMPPCFGMPLYVSGAHQLLDASGALLHAQIRERVQREMTGYVAFV